MLGKYRSNPVKMDTEGGGGRGGQKKLRINGVSVFKSKINLLFELRTLTVSNRTSPTFRVPSFKRRSFIYYLFQNRSLHNAFDPKGFKSFIKKVYYCTQLTIKCPHQRGRLSIRICLLGKKQVDVHANSYPHRGTREGWMEPLNGVFDMLQYF